jgi:hypothetical protein
MAKSFDPTNRAVCTLVRRAGRRRRCLLLVLTGLAAGPAWADPAVRIGSRGGVELREQADPFVGVDVRLSFPLSPLTVNPTFDYVFDGKRTLYEASINALFHPPVSVGRMAPYVGIGFNVTTFAYKESTPDVDDQGSRLGMNLVAGACFDLPFLSPFVQVLQQLGELAHTSIGAGFVVVLDRDTRWTSCGNRAP